MKSRPKVAGAVCCNQPSRRILGFTRYCWNPHRARPSLFLAFLAHPGAVLFHTLVLHDGLLSRMLPTYNPGKFRPDNLWGGGERGIRTLDRVSPIHAFQACAFNHSAISPGSADKLGRDCPRPSV